MASGLNMKLLFKLMLMLFLWASFSPVLAIIESIPRHLVVSINKYYERAGINCQLNGEVIDVIIDQKKALENTINPEFINDRVLNSNIQKTEISMNPITFSGAIGWYYTLKIILDLYGSSGANLTVFRIFLVQPNNIEKNLIYSFNFSRDQYKKIDIEKFYTEKSGKLIENIVGFEISSWYLNQINAESIGKRLLEDNKHDFIKIYNQLIYDSGNDSLKMENEIFSKTHGVSFALNGDTVEILVNQKNLLAAMPLYKRMGFINKNLTQSQINIHKVRLAGIIGWKNAAMILAGIYYNTDADWLNVRAYLDAPDSSGTSKKYLLFTFHFSRDLYNKMNWKNAKMVDIGLTNKKIAKVSSDFHFSNWYLGEIFDKEPPKDKPSFIIST